MKCHCHTIDVSTASLLNLFVGQTSILQCLCACKKTHLISKNYTQCHFQIPFNIKTSPQKVYLYIYIYIYIYISMGQHKTCKLSGVTLLKSPWYNCTGWLGIKTPIYLLTLLKPQTNRWSTKQQHGTKSHSFQSTFCMYWSFSEYYQLTPFQRALPLPPPTTCISKTTHNTVILNT